MAPAQRDWMHAGNLLTSRDESFRFLAADQAAPRLFKESKCLQRDQSLS